MRKQYKEKGGYIVNSQILYNIKSYITERKDQLQDRYECTASDYSLGRLDLIDELVNFIEVEEMMSGKPWVGDTDNWDFYYDIYET